MINRLFNHHRSGVLLIGIVALAGCVSKDDPPTQQFSSRSSSSVAVSSSSSVSSSVANTNAWVEGEFAPAGNFLNQCENPRSGIAPYNNQPYPDEQGAFVDENNYLRSVSNEVYLWYDEITDRNPALYADTHAYFDLLKTTEKSPTGKDKDQFHWHEDTDVYRQQTESGISAGYGVQWVILEGMKPREVAVVYTEPGSPAANAGIERGARVLEIDGIDMVNDDSQSGTNILNAGLFPRELGETHEFVIKNLNDDEPLTVNLTSSQITSAPVQSTKIINTDTGKVGYMVFNAYIATAESALKNTFEHFQAEGVSDLILDMRYNGGGYLAIAAQLGHMIAGTNATGKDFETLEFNDKHSNYDPFTGETLDPMPFYNQGLGLSVTAGEALPSLNLNRVYVLAGGNTCSASEAVINGLRGIDVEVVLIGTTTCGKPYGAYILENCGTSYFTTQFRGVNAKNWGDYSDGFFPGNPDSSNPAELPGCVVNDDFNHLLGDPNEARLAAALHYRENGSCPTGTTPEKTSRGAQQKAQHAAKSDGVIYYPPGLGDKIMRAPQ